MLQPQMLLGLHTYTHGIALSETQVYYPSEGYGGRTIDTTGVPMTLFLR